MRGSERRQPMRKLMVLALIGLVLVPAGVTYAANPDLNDQTDCNTNHMKCREYALNLDAPWYKVAVLLTACDIAFGKCMLSI
jgi:hypothetical protein